MADVIRGAGELRRFLDENTCDLRRLDPAAFRDWLARHLERWRADPSFAARARLRDLRRADPDLRRAEAAHRRAAAADAASPPAARLRELDRDVRAARKAIAGLTAALAGADEGRRAGIAEKLAGFEAELPRLLAEQAALTAASPERQALHTAAAELDRLRAASGVAGEEADLARLLREKGRHSGRAGDTFEDRAAALVARHVVPELAAGGPVDVLTGVTLGAARVEFDLLLVRPADPAEVLAVVEAKRNANDLAHGFRRRQEDLAWLTGDAARYDPAATRTAGYPTGHFDRPAEHREEGRTHRFTSASFRRFRRDAAAGLFLDGLYLVTRAGPLWGVSGAALARIAHRVATDPRWDPADDAYLAELREWCRSLAGPVETPDVLRLYAAEADRARQVLVAIADDGGAGK